MLTTTRPGLGRFVPLFVCLFCGSSSDAQSTTTYIPSKLYPINGTVKAVTRDAIVIERDGQRRPVSVNRNTSLEVLGIGDSGFVRIGSTVTATGSLRERRIVNASVAVHLNPRQTAAQTVRTVRPDTQELTITGIVIGLDPLMIKATDPIRLEVRTGNIGSDINPAPVSAGSFLVEPNPDSREKVKVILGSDLRMIQPEDDVTFYYRDQHRQLAERVVITKTEPFKSPLARLRDAQAAKDSATVIQ